MRFLRVLAFFSALLGGCFDSHGTLPDGATADDGGVPVGCEIRPGVLGCDQAECVCPSDDPDAWSECVLVDVPIASERPPGGVCLEIVSMNCLTGRCGAGELCTFATRQRYEGVVDVALCVGADECVRARDALGVAPASGCLYGDGSPATTGRPDPVTCARRTHDDLCGAGCPCAAGDLCDLSSEAHPWGACRSALSITGCAGCGATCMRVAAPGAVAELHPIAAFAEYCVADVVCRALADLYPEAYDCTVR